LLSASELEITKDKRQILG